MAFYSDCGRIYNIRGVKRLPNFRFFLNLLEWPDVDTTPSTARRPCGKGAGMEQIRKAAKAGSWYPDNPAQLMEDIKEYTARRENTTGRVVAAMVPHAGFAFSGPTAGRSFAAIRANSPQADNFILLGAVHTMMLARPAIWAGGAWDCPLGAVQVNAELAGLMVQDGIGVAEPRPHIGDNALELQIPFVKYCFPQARVVPVAVPPNLEAARTGRRIYHLLREQGMLDNTVVVASTDLTHYGENYGFAPAGEGQQALRWSKENDRRLLDLALELKADEIVPTAQRDRSACGAGALAAAVAFAAEAGCTGGVLLEHTTSFEVMPHERADMFVGYAALVFRV